MILAQFNYSNYLIYKNTVDILVHYMDEIKKYLLFLREKSAIPTHRTGWRNEEWIKASAMVH